MSTFRVHFTQTASASVTVEADDIDDAIDLAYDELPTGVCAQCAGWGRDVGIDLSGVWEPDESAYEVDGEYVEVKK